MCAGSFARSVSGFKPLDAKYMLYSLVYLSTNLEEIKIVPGYREYQLLAHYVHPTDPLMTTANVIIPIYETLIVEVGKISKNLQKRPFCFTLKYLTVLTFSSNVASSSQMRRARGCC